MELPEDYVDLLADELAPFGLGFAAVQENPEETAVLFEAEPQSFVRSFGAVDVEDSYGEQWPPASLELRVQVGPRGDVVEVSFEIWDLLADAAGSDPELAARLGSLADPADQAAAVGEALRAVLEPPGEPVDESW
ncbi:MAG TPA: hypothetical protein PLE12_05565 [Propionicimonas sp.]|jgi:hypothetical protein|nr:hypothetical protein [Propionicimonas sp.]